MTSASGPVSSIRRSFMGGIHFAGSNPAMRDESTDRHPRPMNAGSGAIAVRPSSSASRNASTESPNGDTTPRPVMTMGVVTVKSGPGGVRYHPDRASSTGRRRHSVAPAPARHPPTAVRRGGGRRSAAPEDTDPWRSLRRAVQTGPGQERQPQDPDRLVRRDDDVHA